MFLWAVFIDYTCHIQQSCKDVLWNYSWLSSFRINDVLFSILLDRLILQIFNHMHDLSRVVLFILSITDAT